jgi:hypothetical protein
MPIDQVLLSNTFNEFRITVNQISNTVNDLTANVLSGDIVANTITVGEISSNLIPDANLTYDLGSTTNRWKDLYLSGNTIFLGDAEISYDGAKVVFEVGGANLLDTSNLNASNLNFGTIPDARFPSTLPTANGVNLTFLNASNLGTGTVPDARFPSTLPTANGVNLTFLNATNLGTGTLPDARFPSTLPTANGINLTFLNASNLGTGTLPDARFPSTLPTANGVNLTFLNATNLGTGTVPVARGGTGTGTSATNGQLLIGNGSGFTLATLTGTTNRVTVTNGAGSITLTGPQDLATSSSVQFGSLGVGTAASGTTGEIRATNNITAYFSDQRLKTSITTISNALSKVSKISGVTFQSNEIASKYGYTDQKIQVGVLAQEVKEVLPQVVVPAPFDIGKKDDGTEYSISGENYMTVQYEKLVPLLIEAIKELKAEVDELKKLKG